MHIDDGKLLEVRLYDKLSELFQEIYMENELRNTYGWHASGVDHLIVINDMLIPIQTKYRASRRHENAGINNFLKSVKYISEKMNKEIWFGLWVSRIAPFTDNQDLMKTHKIECVNHFDGIDNLVDLTVKFIQSNI